MEWAYVRPETLTTLRYSLPDSTVLVPLVDKHDRLNAHKVPDLVYSRRSWILSPFNYIIISLYHIISKYWRFTIETTKIRCASTKSLTSNSSRPPPSPAYADYSLSMSTLPDVVAYLISDIGKKRGRERKKVGFVALWCIGTGCSFGTRSPSDSDREPRCYLCGSITTTGSIALITISEKFLQT